MSFKTGPSHRGIQPLTGSLSSPESTSQTINLIGSVVFCRDHKKLKPGLVAFYDIWRGNGAGLFSEEKISMEEISEESEEKKEKWGSIQYKQANNTYSA